LMKNISDVAKGLGLAKGDAHYSQKLKLDAKTMEVVNDLFTTLRRILPAFKNAWPTQAEYEGAKKEWVKAFMQVGLTDIGMIKRGVEKIRVLDSPFIPSPGQFIAMCDYDLEELNLPFVEQAYNEACKNSHFSEKNKKWSHVTVKHACSSTGAWDLQQEPKNKTFPRFKRNYMFAIKLYRKGELRDELEDKSKETEALQAEQKKREAIEKKAKESGVNNYETAKAHLNKLLGRLKT
jgi:hypothetical protein